MGLKDAIVGTLVAKAVDIIIEMGGRAAEAIHQDITRDYQEGGGRYDWGTSAP